MDSPAKAQPLFWNALARTLFAHFGVGTTCWAVAVKRRVVRAVKNVDFMVGIDGIGWLERSEEWNLIRQDSNVMINECYWGAVMENMADYLWSYRMWRRRRQNCCLTLESPCGSTSVISGVALWSRTGSSSPSSSFTAMDDSTSCSVTCCKAFPSVRLARIEQKTEGPSGQTCLGSKSRFDVFRGSNSSRSCYVQHNYAILVCRIMFQMLHEFWLAVCCARNNRGYVSQVASLVPCVNAWYWPRFA